MKELKNVIHYYLPHELRMGYNNGAVISQTRKLTVDNLGNYLSPISQAKPILRHLDFTKEIEHNGEKFVPMLKLHNQTQKNIISGITYSSIIDFMPFMDIQKLFEWHFDVFGLIESNQAIKK